MIRTIVAGLLCSLAILLILPWLILWTLLTGNRTAMYRASMITVYWALRFAGMRVHIEGLENIPSGGCVLAANHASNLDPLTFMPGIPRRISVLMKKEIFRIPILGYGMKLVQFMPMERDGKKGAASIKAALVHLKEGLPFAVFPEGTRSLDGTLRRFKKGAFVMAIEAGVPVVPVSIAGTQNLMRKGDWIIHPGEVTVRFGPAVDSSEYTIAKRSELCSRVESLVATGLPPNQQPQSKSSPRDSDEELPLSD
jgi:1-acyl-sn-glycerol-3-phosphate acyltransferase